ncbi:MAG TPA: heavy metal translocating P-type ATPase [Bacillota bacterium]|nr:heavy metal translocating P-type ATPase [Bacillota bacterium]HOL10242.1 heavy metal translocating P-type ATPase [Bacillota bacterium]HPO98235.1 heavy metal translocating P-type ATPase [Bacillota bacterium]
MKGVFEMGNSDKVQAVKLNIEGMTCSGCAANIAKKLQDKDGVVTATVNLATEKADIRFDATKTNAQELIELINNLGYRAGLVMDDTKETATLNLKVNGMSCTACANRLEQMLNQLDGVVSATINFATETAIVKYDPARTGLLAIKKQGETLGFELTLNDETVVMVDENEVKLLQAKRKMLWSIGFTAVIMTLMLIEMFGTHIPGYYTMTVLLGFPVIFIIGMPIHKASWRALVNRSANMDVLVSLGSLPPYLIGLVGFFIPMHSFIDMAAMIITFHLIGKYLEARAKGKASQAIRKLVQLGAKTAKILVDGVEHEFQVKDLQVGDVMVIRPGEKIPTDGIVIDGSSLVDESMATGESMPVKREKGHAVIGATINKQGLLKVQVSKVGKDTFLAQVIKLVEECQGSKVPIQEFADRVTGYFVPVIILLTIVNLISFLLFPEFYLQIINWAAHYLPWVNPHLSHLALAFITATSVLVIACPCALGLGTPTALMVGSGVGAERGILIRNGEAVQNLKDLKVIAFDKTGTITKGKPEVTDLITKGNISEEELLYYAGTIENGSEHPLAAALVEHARNRKVSLGTVAAFTAVTGMGVIGTVDGAKILVGNRKLMEANQIDFSAGEAELSRLEAEAKTVMMIARDNVLIGIVAVADPLKEDSVAAIAELEKMGIKTAMLTGDNLQTAMAISNKVGISHTIAEVLPNGKVEEIRRLQQQYGIVAMVGDGINDAPALKQANVGIAIGTGTDVAIEAADVTLVRGELSGVIVAIKLSRATFRKIKENYFWAWIYNAIAIPVAFLGLLHPMIGAAAMSLSSLNVIYNSLRLKKVNLEPSYKLQ